MLLYVTCITVALPANLGTCKILPSQEGLWSERREKKKQRKRGTESNESIEQTENLSSSFSSPIPCLHRPHHPFQGKVIVLLSKKAKDGHWGPVCLQISTEYLLSFYAFLSVSSQMVAEMKHFRKYWYCSPVHLLYQKGQKFLGLVSCLSLLGCADCLPVSQFPSTLLKKYSFLWKAT